MFDVTLGSQRCPSDSSGRDFSGFDRCHLVCQYRLMGIVSERPRVKVLNPGSVDCLPFMKSQLLKYSVVIRLGNVRFLIYSVCLFATGLKKTRVEGKKMSH